MGCDDNSGESLRKHRKLQIKTDERTAAPPPANDELRGRLEAGGMRTVEGWLNRQDVPKIICLCGSTRFYQHFLEANYQETMKGNIVLSVGFYPHAQNEIHHEEKGCTPEQKIKLDELHKEKIRLADEVFVLNVGGYIGSSTRSEIEYAESIGRPIRYLERGAELQKAVAGGE